MTFAMLEENPNAFAYDAVADSLARMEAAGVDAPELMLQDSLVVLADVDAAPIFKRMRLLILSMFLGGIGLMLAALVIFLTLKTTSPQNNTPLPATSPNDPLVDMFLMIASACVLGGVALLVLMPFVLKNRVNRSLASQHEQWTGLLPDTTYFNVNIEDANTYDKMKVLAGDYGVAWFDTLGCRLLIEGLRFRYFILKEDLTAARIVKAGGSKGVELTIQLSPQCEFKMTLICEQVRQELKKQVGIPGRTILEKMIEETFEVVVAKK